MARAALRPHVSFFNGGKCEYSLYILCKRGRIVGVIGPNGPIAAPPDAHKTVVGRGPLGSTQVLVSDPRTRGVQMNGCSLFTSVGSVQVHCSLDRV